MSIPAIFKDAALQQQFEEQGYVIVPLLNKEEVHTLTEIFYQFHKDVRDDSFGASSFNQDKQLKLLIRDTLYPIFRPNFEKLFKDYTYFGSSYLYKTTGSNSALAPHQDWSIVDEKEYVAINIWTPLIDTTPENGTLYVVPKTQSQKRFTLRAPTLPFYFQNYFDTVIQCGIPTNAKAGEAVILNQSLIHFSSPNTSKDIRIAITSGIKTEGAPMLFHYKNKHNAIEQYEMPEDFLLDFDNFGEDIYQAPVHGKYKGNISGEKNELSKQEFIYNYATEIPKAISYYFNLKKFILDKFRY